MLCLHGAQGIPLEKANLMGFPLGDVTSFNVSMKEKIKTLHLMGARFKHILAHDSLILLYCIGAGLNWM